MTPEERAFAAATAIGAPAAPSTRRRLSSWRILLLVALVGAGAAVVGFRTGSHPSAKPVVTSDFLPYVDVTATPLYSFENARPSGVVLGFVVSAKSDGCHPSWGDAYSLERASSALDLDRRIARYRQRGGQVAISFGGAANTDLASGCTDPHRLAAAYQQVVDRYSATDLDLDLEGDALSPAAVSRRTEAIHQVQQQGRRAGRHLRVWLTLPIGVSGLTRAGSAALASMLAGNVDLAGVNGLAMDYGHSLPPGTRLAHANESALTRLAAQVRSAFARHGSPVSEAQAWQLVGATPMIGQNDVVAERFTLADARDLLAFAQREHLRRLSMWSLNRDQTCGPNYADVSIVSPNCSGVAQRAGQYAAVFAKFKAGKAPAPGPDVSAPTAATSSSNVDDAATSPYPVWNSVLPYPAGTKIVWHRNVYQAKWWTKGDPPDSPVSSAAQTPWTLIGPVLPGEHPAPTPTMSAGTYPEWSLTRTYRAGERVLYHGVGYQAKWYSQGDVPGIVVSDPGQTPWELITSQ